MRRSIVVVIIGLLWCHPASTDELSWQEYIVSRVDAIHGKDDSHAMAIGEWAELGYQESRSSGLLQQRLADAGFQVEAGVADMPTAFVATFGRGGPVVGFLAEFDALPGFGDAISTSGDGSTTVDAGHACGHNLLGAGAVLGAIAVADWLRSSGRQGTVRVYGAPAEEGGGGKVYLVRAGLLDDLDAMMNWHPDSFNASMTMPNLAMITGKFRFHGRSSHAARAPQLGRSALDGVEAMNVMVNMMREHIGEKTRIHYSITSTNPAPNVVPDRAEVYYFVRDPDPSEMRAVWERVTKAAEGAALGTGTQVDHEVLAGHYPYLPNVRLAEVSYKHLKEVGGPRYSMEEAVMAMEIAASLGRHYGDESEISTDAARIREFEAIEKEIWTGSSDVGDVSWIVPTNWIRTATWVPGTTAHSRQAATASNTSIGLKGMHIAAKVMALTAAELMQSPGLIEEAKKELWARRGPAYEYQTLIGKRPPPLDYMKQGVSK